MVKLREKLVYVDPEGRFSLSRHRWKNEFYLDVPCGRVGLFERRLTLTTGEVQNFERDVATLHVLADEVFVHPEKFGSRVANR
jgi:hypothetical protein